MALDHLDAPEREERLDEAITSYLEEVELGRRPDRQTWLTRYPELAHELAEFFADQDRLDRVATPLRDLIKADAATPSPSETLDVFATADTAAAPGLRAFGDYELLDEIGRGGMGVVFKARQKSLNRLVALKVIRAGPLATEPDVHRFRLEAETIAHLDHPNIVPIYEVGEWRTESVNSPVMYFTMKLIEGGSLAEWIKSNLTAENAENRGEMKMAHSLRSSASSAVSLLSQVARAIHHAHQRGILHRDLKPSNILVQFKDCRSQIETTEESPDFKSAISNLQSAIPLITDFGLAKRVDDDHSMTELGAIVGTPNYLAPEQAWGKKGSTTTATDVYGLGTILYALLTGKPVFQGDSGLDVLEQVKNREPDPPRRINPQVDRDLETICLKCLEKEPGKRYPSAEALAEDLERYEAGEPILARPIGRAARLRRWGRRNPLVASLAGTAVVLVSLLVAGLAVGLGVIWRKEQKTEAALQAVQQARKDAEAREAETKAVLEFVEDKIFAAARPEDQEGGLGHKVTLRRAVEAALPFVQKSFTDQPLIEARLRLTLGNSFLDLGDPKVAAEQFHAARTLYTKHRGPDHRDTLASMNNLAISYSDLGRHADALKLNEETLALMKAKLGPDHPDTLKSMDNLAGTYAHLGRHADALKLREETVALKKAKFVPNHPETILTMHNLANSYDALGQHADALKLREETLALRKAKLVPGHPDTLLSMHNLANSYDAFGRYADALKLREETLALKKAKLGPNHPDTLLSMSGLANSYDALGRHADGLKLREETLALQKAKLGSDHPDTLITMGSLASSYAALGRHADALKLRKETLTLMKAKLGLDHPDTLASMSNLAVSYADLGQHADALKLNEETLALRKAKFGPDHPHTLLSLANLAESLVQLDRGAEAVPLIDECIKRAAGKVVHPQLIPMVMDLRLKHFAKAKDAAGCRTTAELWEQLKRVDAGSLYNAACMRAVTADLLRGTDLKSVLQAKDAVAEADLAMRWLTQAVAAGFKDAAHMEKDTDLDALRDRPDFKRLLAELEAAKEKAK